MNQSAVKTCPKTVRHYTPSRGASWTINAGQFAVRIRRHLFGGCISVFLFFPFSVLLLLLLLMPLTEILPELTSAFREHGIEALIIMAILAVFFVLTLLMCKYSFLAVIHCCFVRK